MARRLAQGVSLEMLWPLLLLTVVFAIVNRHPIRPQDFWWHLRAGYDILTAGSIPTVDVFSYATPGQVYTGYYAYWLAEAVLFALHSAGGPAAVSFVQSLIITSAYGLLLLLCQRASGSWRIATVSTLIAILVGFDHWNVRPQAIAFPIGAAFLFTIDAYKRAPRRRLLLVFPVGMVIWVNCHGTFVIGLAMLGIWLLAELWEVVAAFFAGRRPEARGLSAAVLALVMSLAASLANPRGLSVTQYVNGLLSDPGIRLLITEWQPPTFDVRNGALFLVTLLLTAAILAISPRRPTAYQLLTFLAFGVLALDTGRGTIWYGIAIAPVLSDHFAALVRQYSESQRRSVRVAANTRVGTGSVRSDQHGATWLNIAFVAVLTVGAILSLPWFKVVMARSGSNVSYYSPETPIAATSALLEQHLPGRLFHGFSISSYLLWAAWPEYQVFTYAREGVPPGVWQEYRSISNAPADWQERLATYDVNTLLLSTQEQPALVAAARASPNWRLVYSDDYSVLLTRAGP